MAGSLGKFQVYVGADISEFEKKIKQVQRGLDKAVGKDFARFAGQVRTAMLGLAGAMGIVGVAAVKSAAQLEQQKIAFTTLLKSAQKADTFLRKLQSFAAATPFQFDELVDASKKMLAFGFASEDVLPMLRKVGDAAAGLGAGSEGVDRITRALGQMQGKGKVSTQEINQLAELGINAWEFLAKAAGKSIPEVQKAVEKGLIGADQGIAVILAGLDSRFSGLMAKQSQTINGLVSTIADNVQGIMRSLGDALIENLPIKETLLALGGALDAFSKSVQDSGFVNALKLVFLKILGPETKAMLAAIAAVIGTTLVYSLAAFGLALTRLMVAHPYLLAIAAAATAVVYAFQKWDTIKYMVGSYWDGLKTMFANGGAVIIDTVKWITNGMAGFFSQGFAMMLQMASRALAQIAQELRNTLPLGMGFIADSVFAVARATKTAYMESWKAGNEFYRNSKAASDRATEAFKKANKERLDGYNKAKVASEALVKWHELELTYGKRIGEAFDRAKDTIVSGYAAIKDSGADAWASGISSAASYIDKLIQVTNYMNIVTQAAAALSNAFSMGTGGGAAAPVEMPQIDLSGGGKSGGGGKGKSAAEEAREALNLYRETFREFRDLNKDLQARPTGAAGFLFDLGNEIGGVRDRWMDALDQIAAKFDETSRQGKDAILRGLNEAGIAYELSENGKLNLMRQRMATEMALEQEKQARILEYKMSGQMLEDELRRAYNERDLAEYSQLLTDKNAAFLAHLEGERQAMDAYRQFQMEANRSSLSYMAEAAQTISSGLTDAIVGVVTGTKKASEAFKELGKQTVAMVDKWIVQRQISALMAKTLEKGMAASSAATGSAVAAAWAPAATNVAIATMGGAVGPAMAAMSTAMASMRAMSAVGLAKGGIVTGPTLAMVGEGRHDEAVIPLTPSVLGKMGGGGSGDVRVNVYNQTGQQMGARVEKSVDVQGQIISIWLDGLERNVGGLRDVVGSQQRRG